MDRSTFLPMDMGDGATLYIQTVRVNDGHDDVDASLEDQAVKATECMNKTMPTVTAFAQGMKERLQSLAPDEIELEFSVGFTGKMKAVIASAEAEVGITVHLVWKKEEEKP